MGLDKLDTNLNSLAGSEPSTVLPPLENEQLIQLCRFLKRDHFERKGSSFEPTIYWQGGFAVRFREGSLHKKSLDDEKPSFLDISLQGICWIHPGRLTWTLQILQITHLERKMIFQTSMIMVHVNLPGCNTSFSGAWLQSPCSTGPTVKNHWPEMTVRWCHG